MAVRLVRGLSPRQWAVAWVAAVVVGVAASWSISRGQDADRHATPEAVPDPDGHPAADTDTDAPEPDGQVSDAESLQDGPSPIYPDQAVAGYPDSESGRPDEGPAGPNSRPDWDGPGTGA